MLSHCLVLLVAAASSADAYNICPDSQSAAARLKQNEPTNSNNNLPRRAILSTSASAFLLLTSPFFVSSASASESSDLVVKGTATLQAGVSIDEIGSGAALYVTARPNRPDNVPKAILDGSRGKAPPVLAARYPDPQFPFEFSLGKDDLTPEGASVIEGSDSVWWGGEDLIISSRFDSDGVAATRDPTDLVGRGFYSAKSQEKVSVELQGRGLFGKSVTSKK